MKRRAYNGCFTTLIHLCTWFYCYPLRAVKHLFSACIILLVVKGIDWVVSAVMKQYSPIVFSLMCVASHAKVQEGTQNCFFWKSTGNNVQFFGGFSWRFCGRCQLSSFLHFGQHWTPRLPNLCCEPQRWSVFVQRKTQIFETCLWGRLARQAECFVSGSQTFSLNFDQRRSGEDILIIHNHAWDHPSPHPLHPTTFVWMCGCA